MTNPEPTDFNGKVFAVSGFVNSSLKSLCQIQLVFPLLYNEDRFCIFNKSNTHVVKESAYTGSDALKREKKGQIQS